MSATLAATIPHLRIHQKSRPSASSASLYVNLRVVVVVIQPCYATYLWRISASCHRLYTRPHIITLCSVLQPYRHEPLRTCNQLTMGVIVAHLHDSAIANNVLPPSKDSLIWHKPSCLYSPMAAILQAAMTLRAQDAIVLRTSQGLKLWTSLHESSAQEGPLGIYLHFHFWIASSFPSWGFWWGTTSDKWTSTTIQVDLIIFFHIVGPKFHSRLKAQNSNLQVDEGLEQWMKDRPDVELKGEIVVGNHPRPTGLA